MEGTGPARRLRRFNPTIARVPALAPKQLLPARPSQASLHRLNRRALDLDVGPHGQLVDGNARAALAMRYLRQLGESIGQSRQLDTGLTGFGSDVKNSS